MKTNITAFVNGLITYDYILFGGALVLFLLLIVLSVILRKKTALAAFLALFAFISLICISTFGYIQMHKYLFKNTTHLFSQKKLSFSQAVVVKGSITNNSKFDFKSCKINASAYKVTGNSLKDYIFKFKPFNNMSILEHNISIGEVRDFKMFLEPFTYGGDYNISLEADCR